MNDTRELGEELFSQRFKQIEKIVRAVAAHRRLSAGDSQELYGLVMLKVAQDDFALLRRFQGKSRWGTYLTVIVQRVLLDHRVKEWGRWRPCAKAKRLGSTAVLLDRFINRDRLESVEAIHRLSARGVGESAAELERLAEQIPRRPRRRFVSCETHLSMLADPDGAADRHLEAAERRRAAVHLNQALATAIRGLPESERDLIDLRFGRGWTVRASPPTGIWRRVPSTVASNVSCVDCAAAWRAPACAGRTSPWRLTAGTPILNSICFREPDSPPGTCDRWRSLPTAAGYDFGRRGRPPDRGF